ncbi:LacI family DNA-binding transcriptional regulator [Geosporobacter ferrireducens]|uniref:Transcriptional regulator n=1 Tax=Geosporobacter ferrireducens TaxID=1424294 RepID=A0A1D8GNQ0_9FIRM|nr:LacI family DNA-binding transcriptional regulator [Geosporobacter ferrireducens]AOT72566.1 transcriptional regulator [Geosporobacter ferrireducens]MTI54962.1 LacI family transcriptional regulator [Geosporobacter ferrireducens]
MATIKDVAREARVSVATVSRVLNKHDNISLKTKLVVENAIEKLNYEPNMLGRNLRRSKSGMILALMPSISNPFYSQIVEGIEDIATKNNYTVLISGTDSNMDKENLYFNLLKQKLIDGVILMNTLQEPEFINTLAKKYAIIQCSEYSEEVDIPFISIDNKKASYDAIKFLIKLGHKDIALINSDEEFLYARRRKEGYIEALKESGISIREEFMGQVGLGFDNGRRMVKRLLKLEKPPTAIFAVSDILAIGAIKEIHEAKLRVPEDIAVIGFDNIEFANMSTPSLTTIAQPMYQIGCEATKMLLKRIDNIDTKIDNLILDYNLIIREST